MSFLLPTLLLPSASCLLTFWSRSLLSCSFWLCHLFLSGQWGQAKAQQFLGPFPPVPSSQSLTKFSPMAGLPRQELGHFSLIVSVTLPAVKASGASYVVVFVSRIVQRMSSSRMSWWVSLSFGVSDHFVNLVKCMKPLSKNIQLVNTHKPNISLEIFSPKATYGFQLRNSDPEG